MIAGADGGKTAVTQALASRGQRKAQGGSTPLLFAARTACIECAELLLGAGVEIDLPDPYGVTPLRVAALNLPNDFAACLVAKGADDA